MNWKPFISFGEYLELIGTVSGHPIPIALGVLIKGGAIGKKFADALTPKYAELEKYIKQHIEQRYPNKHNKLKKEIEPVLARINQHYVAEFYTANQTERELVLDEIMIRYRGDEQESCREIICRILEVICEQINDVAPIVATMVKLYGKVDSVEDKVDEIMKFLRDHLGTESTPKEELQIPTITDNNSFYCTDFYARLFMFDEPNATIDKVFVKPRLTAGGNIITELSDWLTDQYPIHILYGKPGVGKSTFSAFLAALIGDEDKSFAEPDDLSLAEKLRDRLHILRLRNVKDQLSDSDAWQTVKLCLQNTQDKDYRNKILLLDGLDEVCVLRSDFKGQTFLDNLVSDMQKNYIGAKIIVTTREGYFPKPDSRKIFSHTMEWTKAEMQFWCDKYAAVGEGKADYCEKFKCDYETLTDDDKRRAIFCVPIVLYLCCHQQIDISQNHTVADVYHSVFHEIYEKKSYNENDGNDVIQYRISWQFTKELAYQMHLHGTLETETAIGSDLVENAMNRTRTILREKYPEDTELQQALERAESRQYFDKHFCIMHFQSGSRENGAEFAHKTVGEYFTAVKLYEDYFECVKDPETTTEQVWRNIFEAFRYSSVPEDILNFLVELTKNGLGDPPERLFEHYYRGMEEQMLWRVMGMPAVAEYPLPQISFYRDEKFFYYTDVENRSYAYTRRNTVSSEQVGAVFRRLSFYLTKAGFNNEKGNALKIREALSSYLLQNTVEQNLCVMKWKNLCGLVLQGVSLRFANLSYADLRDTDFNGADLSHADLSHADLRDADLYGTKLRNAKLIGAELSGAAMNRSDYDTLPDYIRGNSFYNNYTGFISQRK